MRMRKIANSTRKINIAFNGMFTLKQIYFCPYFLYSCAFLFLYFCLFNSWHIYNMHAFPDDEDNVNVLLSLEADRDNVLRFNSEQR